VPVLLIVVVGLAVVGLVLIIVAPWRKVRAEPPLPRDVQARLLLGEPPEQIAGEEPAPESPPHATHDRDLRPPAS
jgi:hypothetical protein